MQKVKYCPNCCSKNDIKATKCSCGFDFFVPEEEEDAALTGNNTLVIVDNVPLGLWTFIGFISFSIAGIILGIKWKKDRKARSNAAFKGAIAFGITAAVVGLIILLYFVLKSNGKIV